MAPVQISEVKGSGRENRTAAHSHIKGLGLRSDGIADKISGGFIGQAAAREVNCNKNAQAVHEGSSARIRWATPRSEDGCADIGVLDRHAVSWSI